MRERFGGLRAENTPGAGIPASGVSVYEKLAAILDGLHAVLRTVRVILKYTGLFNRYMLVLTHFCREVLEYDGGC